MKSVTTCKDSLNSRTLNANAVCATGNKYLVDSNQFACVMKMLNDVNARTKKPTVVPISTIEPKSHANKLVATPYKKRVASNSTIQKPQSYFRMLYEQTIGQFCDADLEVAFRKSTCFVRDLHGNDLLTDNHGSNIYTISLQESTSSNPHYLMAKAIPTQAWEDQASKGSKSSCDGCWVAKSWITCVNRNGNITLSEAHGVSLRITSDMRTVFDAPSGYVGLYTHSFFLVNIRLPLTKFFYELMIVSSLSTSSEGSLICFELFFYVQDSIIPAKYPQLLSEQNKLDLKSFKDKLPLNIEENPMNFIYIEDDEDLIFLRKEPSMGFGTGSPSVSVNIEPMKANEKPNIQPIKVTSDSGGSLKPKPHVKRKLASGSSTSRATHAKTSSSKDDVSFLIIFDDDEGLPDVLKLKDANACHLKISVVTPSVWKNHLDNYIDLELLDLYDRCYARQAVIDNVVNKRERTRDEECEGLWVKCEAAMTDFEKNHVVVAFREKISALSTEAKEHKLNLDRMMLESQKWAGYQQSLSTLESKVTALETRMAWLEAAKVDDMGSLVGKLVSSAIVYGRCRSFEQVIGMKEPFDLSKVKGCRSSYKKDHTQASNDLATTTFPCLDEFVVDPSVPIEALLSKKTLTFLRSAPSRTQVPLVSS
nr:integrase, catalytic region, zinc finger, CCHC-type, peptidase aspartic, catalytic [Tanacetum cinerariifolium]